MIAMKNKKILWVGYFVECFLLMEFELSSKKSHNRTHAWYYDGLTITGAYGPNVVLVTAQNGINAEILDL